MLHFVYATALAITLGLEPFQAETIAVVGGTIIDGHGGAPISSGVIVIDHGRITAIGDENIAIPAHARRIQAEGKYIIPGLMDANEPAAGGAPRRRAGRRVSVDLYTLHYWRT